MESPHFFVDRSLGRNQVPRLLRADGWTLTTLAEHYGIPEDERIADVDWLALAGQEQWPVLMKDAKLQFRSGEAAALLRAGVRAFSLAHGNLRAAEMAECFIVHREAIWAAATGGGPALYAVTRSGIRLVEL